MAIRITGTIAGLAVDLTLEGLDSQSLGELSSSLVKQASISDVRQPGETSQADLAAKASPGESELGAALGSHKALQLALVHINQCGSVDSCDLINYLSDNGFSDSAIKRALLLLRQGGDVQTVRSEDGLQRVYRRH